MLDHQNLPDIMYFGASRRFSELKGRVFLTPHIGIASLFFIDTSDLFPKGYQISCNLGYEQWDYPNDMLSKPLPMVNVTHNIPAFRNIRFSGTSSGFIHVIDIRNVKNRLTLFDTNDPDRELIYHGEPPLTIVDCIPHTVQWDFCFSQENMDKFGEGSA